MPEDQGEGVVAEARRILFGLGFSAVIIAIFVSIFFYVIPHFRSSKRAWEQVGNDEIVLNYRKTTEYRVSDSQSLLKQLTETKEDVIKSLELNQREVPDRIQVYIHRSLSSLKSTIARRKSPNKVDVPLALLDVIEGRDPEPVLVRLLLAFTWGRPSSELLRFGLENYFAEGYGEVHARAAALGKSGFDLSELSHLAKKTDYLRTFQDRIYDTFDSPRASAGLDLGTFSRLSSFGEAESPYRYELTVQAESFVRYLLDAYGLTGLRKLWQADSLEAGVRGELGLSPEQLAKDWGEYQETRLHQDQQYGYYRARALFGQGEIDGALEELRALADARSVEAEVYFLRGLVQFYSGHWERAAAFFGTMDSNDLSGTRQGEYRALSSMLSSYRGGKSWIRKGFRIFAPEGLENTSVMARDVSSVFKRWEEEVAGLEANFPIFSILFSKNEESFSGWEEVSKPDWVVVLQPNEDLRRRAAEAIVRSVGRTPTYSSLLFNGLAGFLARESIYAGAAEIVENNSWSPLEGAVFPENGKSEIELEAAGFVKYVVDQYGWKAFSEIWQMTTPLGGDNSLELALREVLGKGLNDVEYELIRLLEENYQSE